MLVAACIFCVGVVRHVSNLLHDLSLVRGYSNAINPLRQCIFFNMAVILSRSKKIFMSVCVALGDEGTGEN